jgi:hypothetical protein
LENDRAARVGVAAVKEEAEAAAHVVQEKLKDARALLLPGMPMPEQLLQTAVEADVECSVLERPSLQKPLNVGSGLKEEDWDQIDQDEV